MNKNPNNVRLAVITGTTPRCLTKKFTLRKGELQKHAGGILVEGSADVVSVEGLSAFRKLLLELRTNQALSYGIPAAASVRLTTKEKWLEEGRPEGTIPRTADMFRWPEGGGVLMLDYDPPPDGIPLNREGLVSALRRAVPGLCDAAMLWWPSASSFIINTETGQQVRGLRGQRLYILVANASDIPRAGKAFTEALWAAGSGYFAVSTSGSLLSRTIFDGSVWQTNRLDFAAGAACRAPLRQERGEPVLVPGVVEFVDTETAIPDPTAEIKAEAHAARDRTRDAVRAEGEAVREAWIEDRVGKLVPDNADDDTRDAARATVRRAVENNTLSGKFTVQVMEVNEPRAVTVVEVLDDPSRYDGMLTLDPLEPDYDGGRVVGKLYTTGVRPNLFSFAHGGRTFRLMRQPARIEIVKGRTYDVVQATLETLRRASEAFDFGGALVTVDRGRVHPLDDAGLIHFLGGVVQYWRWNSARRPEPSETLEDPPARVAKQILSLGAGRHLKTLSAVVTVPTLRPDGTVFDKPGYDEATGLLFEALEDVVPVPSAPDREEVGEALETLLHPFREFPVVAPDDWGVLLAALLTAVVRPALPTAPGFGFDAPVQGSGKTLLANCVGVLASGQAPAVWPHTAGKDDEEVRKRLFAALRQGYRALVWDNVVGTFNSAAMSAALTSSNFTDRILGKSESISVPNKAILLMTGNNLTLAGDMARRVLTCRIDPGTDHPFAREFDLDPLVHTRKHRQEMAAAGLTIVRGWMTADAERAPGRMASFEMWDDIVRQAVAWVGREIRPGQFGDPMNAVFTAQSGDPEQETLGEMLLAWRELFGGDPASSGEVLEVVSPVYGFQPTGSEVSLRDCLREFSERAIVSKKSLGRALGYRVGRIVGGLKLEGNKDPHTKTNLWRVVEVD